MAKYNLENYTAADGLGFPLNFRRGNPNPLDNSSVWKTYTEAVTYATTDPTAYVGQILSVVDTTTNTVTVYSIQDEDGTLKKVGTSPVGDESTITVAEDGTVSLYGIAGLELTRVNEEGGTTNISYQPLLVNGKLTWVEPSATTVEGLATEIEGLKTRITTVENAINDPETGLTKKTTDNKTAIEELAGKVGKAATETEEASGIYAELETKANAADVYTRAETDSAISTAIADADHLKRVTVNSVEEINVEAADADQYIYMVAKENGTAGDYYEEYMVSAGAVEKVGNWKVDLSEYAKTTYVNTELGKKVDAVEDSRLMTNTEGTKLEGIESGAQVNKIESVDTEQFEIDVDKKLTLLDIAMSKVTGLTEALAAVDANVIETVKVNGTPLVVDTDKSVDISVPITSDAENKIAIAEDGTMEVNSININKIVQGEDDVLILNGGESGN